MDNSAVVDYRARLLEQLSKSADAFCAACRAVPDPWKPVDEHHCPAGVVPAGLRRAEGPLAAGDTKSPGWNVHQLAQHVRDVDVQSYRTRVLRTLKEECPTFPKFDADQWAAQHYDAAEPLEKILAEFESNIHALVEELKPQPDSAWSRLGRHEIQGDRTLQIWVERSLEHIREHLETVQQVTGAQ